MPVLSVPLTPQSQVERTCAHEVTAATTSASSVSRLAAARRRRPAAVDTSAIVEHRRALQLARHSAQLGGAQAVVVVASDESSPCAPVPQRAVRPNTVVVFPADYVPEDIDDDDDDDGAADNNNNDDDVANSADVRRAAAIAHNDEDDDKTQPLPYASHASFNDNEYSAPLLGSQWLFVDARVPPPVPPPLPDNASSAPARQQSASPSESVAPQFAQAQTVSSTRSIPAAQPMSFGGSSTSTMITAPPADGPAAAAAAVADDDGSVDVFEMVVPRPPLTQSQPPPPPPPQLLFVEQTQQVADSGDDDRVVQPVGDAAADELVPDSDCSQSQSPPPSPYLQHHQVCETQNWEPPQPASVPDDIVQVPPTQDEDRSSVMVEFSSEELPVVRLPLLPPPPPPPQQQQQQQLELPVPIATVAAVKKEVSPLKTTPRSTRGNRGRGDLLTSLHKHGVIETGTVLMFGEHSVMVTKDLWLEGDNESYASISQWLEQVVDVDADELASACDSVQTEDDVKNRTGWTLRNHLDAIEKRCEKLAGSSSPTIAQLPAAKSSPAWQERTTTPVSSKVVRQRSPATTSETSSRSTASTKANAHDDEGDWLSRRPAAVADHGKAKKKVQQSIKTSFDRMRSVGGAPAPPPSSPVAAPTFNAAIYAQKKRPRNDDDSSSAAQAAAMPPPPPVSPRRDSASLMPPPATVPKKRRTSTANSVAATTSTASTVKATKSSAKRSALEDRGRVNNSNESDDESGDGAAIDLDDDDDDDDDDNDDEKEREIVLLGSHLTDSNLAQLKSVAQRLRVTLVNSWTENVTHLVMSADESKPGGKVPRTIKYLYSLMVGAWIVDVRWLDACDKANRLVDESKYLVPGCVGSSASGTALAMHERSDAERRSLFAQFAVHLHGIIDTPDGPKRDDVLALLRMGGAHVLDEAPTPFDVQRLTNRSKAKATKRAPRERVFDLVLFLVDDKKLGVRNRRMLWEKAGKNSKCAAVVRHMWAIDSISSGRALPIDKYVVDAPDDDGEPEELASEAF
jgi:hypothetical protein